jgi:hypothetical protein
MDTERSSQRTGETMTTEERVAKRIVEGIVEDMDDRRGMGFNDIDNETQEEIRAAWERIVVDVLTKGEGSK